MKQVLLFSLVSLSLISFSQKKDCNCAEFRTGTFYIINKATPRDTCFIKRTENSQTEWIPNKVNQTFNVIWVNECTYVLREKSLRTTKKYHRTDVISKIIETGKNYYRVKAWVPRHKRTIITLHVYNP